MLLRFHADMSWLLLILHTFVLFFNSHKMKSYMKPNVVGDFHNIETFSKIGKIVLSLFQSYLPLCRHGLFSDPS